MRPYLILMAVVLTAVAAFGQQPVPSGPCFYRCGPFIPLLTTPEVSFQQVSPNPVGASNATTGLIAGATNSTLSEVEGSTSSVHTEAVWYQGGDAPLITPQIHLSPEVIGPEGRPRRGAVRPEGPNGVRPREPRPQEARSREDRRHDEHGQRSSEEARADWTYFTGPASAAKAGRVYGSADVSRQNDKNGAVKYSGKTEKM